MQTAEVLAEEKTQKRTPEEVWSMYRMAKERIFNTEDGDTLSFLSADETICHIHTLNLSDQWKVKIKSSKKLILYGLTQSEVNEILSHVRISLKELFIFDCDMLHSLDCDLLRRGTHIESIALIGNPQLQLKKIRILNIIDFQNFIHLQRVFLGTKTHMKIKTIEGFELQSSKTSECVNVFTRKTEKN